MSSGLMQVEKVLTDYWFLGGFILAFLAGYLLSRLLNRRSARRMQEDLDDLRWRLQSSEKLLSGKVGETWRQIVQTVSDVDGRDRTTEQNRRSASVLETAEQQSPLKSTEPEGTSLKRKIRLIKVEGPEGPVESPSAVAGLEKSPPQINKSYEVFTDYGTLIVTSPVLEIAGDHIRTQNSLYKIDAITAGMPSPDFEAVWDRIKHHEGTEFETKTGMTFTYKISGDSLHTSRTNYKISKANFAKAFAYGPITGPGAIKNEVIGPAYVWAILHDDRIVSNE